MFGGNELIYAGAEILASAGTSAAATKVLSGTSSANAESFMATTGRELSREAEVVDVAKTMNGTECVIKEFKNCAKSIKTPYGDAAQDFSREALELREYVGKGGTLYRGGTFNRSNAADAQFWATESPLTPGYADKFGVDFTKMDYIIKGKIKPNAEFITRYAPGLNGNTGGAVEVVTNPNSVVLEYFYMD